MTGILLPELPADLYHKAVSDYLQLSVLWTNSLAEMLEATGSPADWNEHDFLDHISQKINSCPGDLWDWISSNGFQWDTFISLSGQYFIRFQSSRELKLCA